MTNQPQAISILGKTEWELSDLNDLLIFLQSSGGKKLRKNLDDLAVSYDTISQNELKMAKMENPAVTLHSILKARDLANNVLTIKDLFLNETRIIEKYNSLYRRLEGGERDDTINGDESA